MSAQGGNASEFIKGKQVKNKYYVMGKFAGVTTFSPGKLIDVYHTKSKRCHARFYPRPGTYFRGVVSFTLD